LKVQDGKVVNLEQTIKSDQLILAKWQRKLIFNKEYIAQIISPHAYNLMINLSEGESVTFEDDRLVNTKYDSALKQTIPLEKLPSPLIEGMLIWCESEVQCYQAIVKKIYANKAVIDANDPWHGKLLTYQLKIIEVRNTTNEENSQESVRELHSLI